MADDISGRLGHTDTSSEMLASCRSILVQIHETLQESTIAQHGSKDARSRFWRTYKREAAEYDSEFLDSHRSNMDIVLIFSGLFSAVCTSFIIAMEPSLNADPTDTTQALLKILIHTINNDTFPGQNLQPPEWTGPTPTVIWTQTLIYASLSASLLAALGAMLGKQWLSHFSHLGRGSVDARGRRRQQKLDGLQAWHLDAVLECLPVLLQISLLLFGTALGANIWTQQPIIAAPVIAATAFGVLFYTMIVVSSLISRDCPFQTPTSRSLRMFGGEVVNGYFYAMQKFCILVDLLPFAHSPYLITRFARFSEPPFRQSSYAEDEQSLSIPRVAADAPSILWILETSTDPDVIMAAANMVPEVEWPLQLDVSGALVQLRDTFLGCFEGTHCRQPRIGYLGRDRAVACGKALLHLQLERLCFEEMPALFDKPSELRITGITPSLLPDIDWFSLLEHDDQELKFICDTIRRVCVLGIRTHPFIPKVPDSFLSWTSHSFLYALYDPQPSGNLKQWAFSSVTRLLAFPLLPRHILANCLLAASSLVGLPLNLRDLMKLDKSAIIENQLVLLLQQLRAVLSSEVIYSNNNPDIAVYAIRLLRPLSVLLEGAEFRQIFLDHDIPEWAFRLGRSFVRGILRRRSIRKEQLCTWDSASAALHLSVVSAVSTQYGPSDLRGIWRHLNGGTHGHQRTPEDFDCIAAFLLHHYESNNCEAVADALLVLSEMRAIPSGKEAATYLKAIVFGMESDTHRVRHAALMAANACREILSELHGNSFIPDDFSRALRTSVFSDLRPPGDAHEPFSLDNFLYCERDSCYLQLLLFLTRNKLWDVHLYNHGHFDRCCAIAARLLEDETPPVQRPWSERLSLYLVAILSRIGKRNPGVYHEWGHDRCRALIYNAWMFTSWKHSWKDEESHVYEAFPLLVDITIRRSRPDPEFVTHQLKIAIRQTIEALRSTHWEPSMPKLLDKLVELIDEDAQIP